MPIERLQKIISRAGIASRREAEQLIVQGRVRVNGKTVTKLGTQADSQSDRIEVDGRSIVRDVFEAVVLLINKPREVICTRSDPQGRKTVFQLLPRKWRTLFTIGRLDYNTEGLILATNDGELSNLLAHPRSHVPRTYEVKVRGLPPDAALNKLRRGFLLDGKRTRKAEVMVLKSLPTSTWMRITIHEGRNRQVRRMFEAVGHQVSKLKRVALGSLDLGDLPIGAFRELRPEEIASLRNAAQS